MTRIVHACAMYEDIQSVDIRLRKTPVQTTGHLGVRLAGDKEDLDKMRGAS